jgi:hypothetical protein
MRRSSLLAVVLVPKLGCPLCWPALAALCSFFGVRFAVLDHAFLLLNAAALLFAAKLALQQQCGLACRLAIAALSAALVFRLGAGLLMSIGMGAITALLVFTIRRFARFHTAAPVPGAVSPCCSSNPFTL